MAAAVITKGPKVLVADPYRVERITDYSPPTQSPDRNRCKWRGSAGLLQFSAVKCGRCVSKIPADKAFGAIQEQ